MENLDSNQNQLAKIEEAISFGQFEVARLLGQSQYAELIENFGRVSKIKIYAYLKETKKYKGLSVVDINGKLLTVSTWQEFCKSQGKSFQHIDEDIQNLSAFGEEFLETSQRMGIGYRDLRKLRKLPEDEQQVIINGEAVKAEDKESLIDIIEEMSVKHAKDKETLQKKLTTTENELTKRIKELEADNQAKDSVLSSKNKKIDELDQRLTIRKDISQHHIVQAEVEAHINDELAQASASVLTAISQFNAKVELLTNQAGENFLPHLKDKIQQDISVVYNRIAQVGFEVGVDLEIMMKPDWLDTDSQPADIPDFELSTYTEADLDK